MSSFAEQIRIDTSAAVETTNVLRLVRDERDSQDRKWGVQDHPVYQPGYGHIARGQYAAQAKRYQSINDRRAETCRPASYDSILLEEVYEALGEEDDEKRERELVQVAAVAVKMAELSRRKRLAAKQAEQMKALWRGSAGLPVRYAVGMDQARSSSQFTMFEDGRVVPNEEEKPVTISWRTPAPITREAMEALFGRNLFASRQAGGFL